MYDVVAIGETMIDFSPSGFGPMGNPTFEMNPGGAPLNCLAANVCLGGTGAFVGMVGEDFFGRFLQHSMENMGIGTENLFYTGRSYTTIDFVSNAEDGERDFAFFRNPGADTLLEPGMADIKLIQDARILHFGSVSLSEEPARSATFSALEERKKQGGLVSFDPNYRDRLWDSPEQAVDLIRQGVKYSDILKVSMEECTLLTGNSEKSIAERAKLLIKEGVKLLFVTDGAKGAYYFTDQEEGFVKGFQVNAKDTTGCGDAFLGAIHYQLCHEKEKSIYEMVRFANAVGALCATGKGGFSSMPGYKEVKAILENNGL